MSDLNQKNIENFEVIYIAGIKFAMEVGAINRVRFILDQLGPFVEVAKRDNWTIVFQNARIWLADAEEYERVHGAGTLFDHDHPRIKAVKAIMTERHLPKEEIANAVVKSSSLSNGSVQPSGVMAA